MPICNGIGTSERGTTRPNASPTALSALSGGGRIHQPADLFEERANSSQCGRPVDQIIRALVRLVAVLHGESVELHQWHVLLAALPTVGEQTQEQCEIMRAGILLPDKREPCLDRLLSGLLNVKSENLVIELLEIGHSARGAEVFGRHIQQTGGFFISAHTRPSPRVRLVR